MLWALLGCLMVAVNDAAMYTDLEKLHRNLTANYDKTLLPSTNLSHALTVNLDFRLLSIQELDEKTSRFTAVALFRLAWNDFNMKWNMEEYGNIIQTNLPQNSIWKPELILVNPYDTVEPLGFDSQPITIFYDGTMVWRPYDVFKSTCSVDVTFYPYDVTSCVMEFTILGYLPTQVNAVSTYSKINQKYFSPNGLWEIIDTDIRIQNYAHFQLVMVQVTLKRRPTFIILNTLVPISVMGFLHLLVFLLPAGSGERVGFSVTVLLAVAVFMTIVTDSLPSTSEPNVPILCYLLSTDLFVNALVTICVILGLRLHHRPETENVPRLLHCIVGGGKWWQRSARSVAIKTQAYNTSDGGNKDVMGTANGTHTVAKQTHIICDNNGNNRNEDYYGNATQVGTRDMHGCTTWGQFAKFVDNLFFILFMLVIVGRNIAAAFVFNVNSE